MSLFNCSCKNTCATGSLVIAGFIGIIAAFLQITGTISLGTPLLWAALGIALGFLAILVVASALFRTEERHSCLCSAVNTLLVGIGGTVLLAVILLTVDIVAASVLGAILTGLLAFFAALTLAATACYVKCLTDC